jgi:HAE1 family hydrophobic/amphiphilic exporter-1
MMWLVELSIRRQVFAVMIIAGLVGLGWVSMDRVGVALFPNIELPYVSVTTVLEGASPETIETEITDVIEENINSIDGIKSLQSFSSEGVSRIQVEFEVQEDVNIKVQDVRDKVQISRGDLPSDAKPSIVDKVDPAAAPIISVLISADLPIGQITDFADNVVKEALQRISGVGSVSLVGGRDREIRIWLDNNRLRSFGITAEDVHRAIQRENIEVPGGVLDIAGGAKEFGIKTISDANSAKEFEELAIAYHENGVLLRVKDVATVEDGLEDARSSAFLNGTRGVSLEIRKQSGRNTVSVSNAVKAEVERMRSLAPKGVKLIVTQDSSKFVESSIHDVNFDIQIAILLVTLITFIFLLNFRATLIVIIAIPTSLISTFFAFYLMEFTINLTTLLALTVAIGLLVDDAIVVIESIFKELEHGKPPLQAALDGTKKVGLAVLAGTVATLAVFVPIAFMGGVVGSFFLQYGLAVVFSVSVSLLVALTLTPMLASRYLTNANIDPRLRFISNFLDRVDLYYAETVKQAIRHRYWVILLGLLSLVVGAWFAAKVPTGFVSRTDRSEFLGSVELPLGTGIKSAEQAAANISGAFLDIKYVEDVFISIGTGVQSSVNKLDMYVALTPKGERYGRPGADQFEIMDEVREALAEVAPDTLKTSISEVPWVGGTSSNIDLDLILRGTDLNLIGRYANTIVEEMKRNELFSDPATTFVDGRPEAQIRVDRRRSADLGVSARSVATTARIALGGLDTASFEDGGKRFDVRLRLLEGQRQSLQHLSNVQVKASNGKLVDLGAVSALSYESGPSQIDRYDRARKISVQASAATGVALGDATDALLQIVKLNPPPDGVSYVLKGMASSMQETVSSIVIALAIALITLYMVLASQFNSFSQPLLIMLTAPLSFSGAFAGLYFFGLELSLFAQIGLIGLMGIVMKNGILLVDRANQLIEGGMTGQEAITKACPERLRPVLMTALAAVFGMIPVAISTSDAAEWRNELGALIIGGLSTSTLLTLIVVPAAFMLPRDVARIATSAHRKLSVQANDAFEIFAYFIRDPMASWFRQYKRKSLYNLRDFRTLIALSFDRKWPRSKEAKDHQSENDSGEPN